MTQQWRSVMAAAEELGVSASTVRRRISEGKLTWRFGESGKEVLVGDAAEMSTACAEPQQALGMRRPQAYLPWVVAAGVAFLALIMIIVFGLRSNRAAVSAEMHQWRAAELVEQVAQARDELLVVQKAQAALETRLSELEKQRAAAVARAQQKIEQFARLEAEKQQTELALQGALASLRRQQQEQEQPAEPPVAATAAVETE